jgi:hypothetical protein
MYKGIKCPLPPRGVSKWSLRKGIEVELEHTSSRRMAACIRNVHLGEMKDYYVKLVKMETK